MRLSLIQTYNSRVGSCDKYIENDRIHFRHNLSVLFKLTDSVVFFTQDLYMRIL